MKIFLVLALLGAVLAEDCPTYVKKGCFRRNQQVYNVQVANNRDKESSVFIGTIIDWRAYEQSLAKLGCECAKKVKQQGGVAFAMGFYGECWMAKDIDAVNKAIEDIGQLSPSCIGGDYSSCNGNHAHCIGTATSQYIYTFPSAAPPAIDGGYGEWSEWTTCSKSCGEGMTERERACNSPVASNGGKDCPNEELTETKSCKIVDCPVNGQWGEWGNYEECPVTCGGASQKKTRKCDSPAPAHGGAACSGSDEESKSCGTSPCPVNGQWGEWGDYEECPVTCGSASQKKTRKCDSPAPAHGGAACPGSDEESKSCGTSPCPVNGQWGAWGAFESCPVTCGGASQKKTRKCNSPAPAHGGAVCPGSDKESQSCGTSPCPVNAKWGAWSNYGSCSKTCHSGTQQRSRSCSGALHGGSRTCPGSDKDSKACNVNKRCPYWTGEYTVRVCERDSKTISCSDPHQTIRLTNYFWGRTTKSYCKGGIDWTWSTNCRGGHGRIRQNCEYRNSCNLQANNSWMNDDPCWGTPKYAEIKYKCYG